MANDRANDDELDDESHDDNLNDAESHDDELDDDESNDAESTGHESNTNDSFSAGFIASAEKFDAYLRSGSWSSRFVKLLIALPFLSLLFWLLFCNHVGINHIGVAYNMSSGKVNVQDEPGWYITNPVTFVYDISTLPIKVELPSEAKVINVKFVRFKKEGIEEFIQLQGFNYLTGSSSFDNVMMGYAFSGKKFPFIEVVDEAGATSVIASELKWPTQSEATKSGDKK